MKRATQGPVTSTSSKRAKKEGDSKAKSVSASKPKPEPKPETYYDDTPVRERARAKLQVEISAGLRSDALPSGDEDLAMRIEQELYRKVGGCGEAYRCARGKSACRPVMHTGPGWGCCLSDRCAIALHMLYACKYAGCV